MKNLLKKINEKVIRSLVWLMKAVSLSPIFKNIRCVPPKLSVFNKERYRGDNRRK